MAEYIDRERLVDWDTLIIKDENGEYKQIFDIGEIPVEDVVERSEAESLREQMNTWQAEHAKRVLETAELRSKIDKAIEEMTSRLYKGADSTAFKWQNLGINMCIEILKKNINA